MRHGEKVKESGKAKSSDTQPEIRYRTAVGFPSNENEAR